MRESAEVKGKRYIVEGRVLIELVQGDHVIATVKGDGRIHFVEHQRGGWSCDCPAKGRCCHLLAVGLVTAPGARLATTMYGAATS